ncbi:MAG: hypothetical protein AAF802_32070 [Planctomycetota bacterium]
MKLIFAILTAIALCQGSFVFGQSTNELQSTIETLTRNHALATKPKLKAIGISCHMYESQHGKFPSKPSDLRPHVGSEGWRDFFATYHSEKIEHAESLEDDDERWIWIDKETSFVFHRDVDPTIRGAESILHFPILAEEKRPIHAGFKVAVHLDGTVSFAKLGSYPQK